MSPQSWFLSQPLPTLPVQSTLLVDIHAQSKTGRKQNENAGLTRIHFCFHFFSYFSRPFLFFQPPSPFLLLAFLSFTAYSGKLCNNSPENIKNWNQAIQPSPIARKNIFYRVLIGLCSLSLARLWKSDDAAAHIDMESLSLPCFSLSHTRTQTYVNKACTVPEVAVEHCPQTGCWIWPSLPCLLIKDYFSREGMLIADSVCSTGYRNVETCGHKSSADKHNPVQLGSVLSVQSSGQGSTRLSCSVPACFCLHTGHWTSPPPSPLPELQCSKPQEKKIK